MARSGQTDESEVESVEVTLTGAPFYTIDCES